MAVDWFDPSHGILWLLKLGNFITYFKAGSCSDQENIKSIVIQGVGIAILV